MNINATNLSQFFYNYVFVIGGVGTALWLFFKLGVHKAIEEHMDKIEQKLENKLAPFNAMDSRLDRIEYALYNDGKTGLINKVDQLIERQQEIKIDVEIMKTEIEHK